jgi:penicillin-binding protein 1C
MSKRRRVLLIGGALSATLITCALGVLIATTPYDPQRLDPAAGGPLVIEDRNGVVLRSVPSPDGRPGREHWVPLSRIASHAVLAVVASEDQGFFEHAGVDARAIVRALWLNVQGTGRYGASTLTMQLARMVWSPGAPRTLSNKLRETVLALRIERALSKQQILEQYLNRAYYGRGAYGIDAAAARYFGKPAAALSAGEATLLAILPRSPGAYDPIERLPRALHRRQHVLALLVAQGKLSAAEALRTQAEPLAPSVHEQPSLAPHFVDHVLAERARSADAQLATGRLRTTLDARLQALLEQRVAEHVASLADKGVSQAGVVVLDTQAGEVLAMVGSAGYHTTADGQLNITTWRRYPGSALKPFVYGAAIEHGASPATLAYDVYDVPSRYRVRDIPPREHGPVRYREALAGSYNLAAVHVLERVGEARVLEHLRRAGVFELPGQANDYGLRLALGNTKVRLLDLAAAYGAFARRGLVTAPRSLAWHVGHDGVRTALPAHAESRVFSPEASALVLDMLADAHARTKVFGMELPTDLPYPVAVKTGTARGFADNVAVFLTSELTVAAWSGRFDGAATRGMRGMDGAAPLARAALLAASRGRTLSLPKPPAALTRRAVCPLSGMLPGPACSARFEDRFIPGTEPTGTCSFHEHHQGETRIVYPAELQGWAKRRGGRS